MITETDLGAAALDLAKLGYAVFPLARRSKKPLKDSNGLLDATRDPDTIAAWWAFARDNNIGIATGAISGIVVIDIDEEKDGHLTLAALEAEHGELPPTLTTLTGNGRHFIFRHPGGDLRNSAGTRFGRGIDSRGDGGYIVAPPSWHPDGVRYEWLTQLEPASLPAWIHEILKVAPAPTPPPRPSSTPTTGDTPYARKVLEERAREVRDAPPGQWNDLLNQAAFRMGQLVAGGQISEHQVVDELTAASAARGHQGSETAGTIRSGLSDGAQSPQYPDPTRTRSPATSSRARPIANEPPDPDGDPAPPRPTPGTAGDDDPEGEINDTDLGNARRLIRNYGHELRYATHLAGWLRWNGNRWIVDTNGHIGRCAHATAQAIWGEAVALDADDAKKRRAWSLKSESAQRLEAMVREAAKLRGVAISADQLDADPWLLNLANGTLNLRTGELADHDPLDLITKLAPVDYQPDATDPRWDAYLDSALDSDPDLASFLQRAVGYTLTGDTSEEVLFFAHGPTETGKSTFLEALKATLGDYARNADFETFLVRDQGGTARPDIARLAGARLVTSSEVDDGKRFAEGLVKTLTGGDTITARYLYRDEFEYRPQFKLWLAANRKPRANHGDGAIWRRIRLVPFVHPPKVRDPNLKHHLANDPGARAAILAWAVAGCAAWRTEGLRTPEAVRAATEAYRQEQDPLGEFLEDHAVFESESWCRAGELRSAYEKWAHEQGLRSTLSPRAFRELLEERGATSERRRIEGKTTRVWDGVRLLTGTEILVEAPRDRTESNVEPARDARDARDTTSKSPPLENLLGEKTETASHPSRASRADDRPRTKACSGCGKTVEISITANPDWDITCRDCFKRTMDEEPF